MAVPAASLARRGAAALFALMAGGACGDAAPDGAFRPTDPILLSTGSPTKDEDPSVVRAADGKILVAWFSDRGGNPDIDLTSTEGGTDWTDPVRVTADPGGDFNPHLIQESAYWAPAQRRSR